MEGGRLVPLPALLAPGVWRGLRRAAKRDAIARNVRRAIDAAGGVPRGELVTLVGGSACDGEVWASAKPPSRRQASACCTCS